MSYAFRHCASQPYIKTSVYKSTRPRDAEKPWQVLIHIASKAIYAQSFATLSECQAYVRQKMFNIESAAVAVRCEIDTLIHMED